VLLVAVINSRINVMAVGREAPKKRLGFFAAENARPGVAL